MEHSPEVTETKRRDSILSFFPYLNSKVKCGQLIEEFQKDCIGNHDRNAAIANAAKYSIDLIKNDDIDDITVAFMKECSAETDHSYILSPEETIYNTTNNKNFNVYGENDLPLLNRELWAQFCQRDYMFPYRSAVFVHLKSKGWIVRSGLKFGCDFMLYEGSIDSFHSRYGVLVLRDSGAYGKDFSLDGSDRMISTLVRVLHSARKRLVLCFVEFPTNKCCLDHRDLHSAIVRTVKIARFKRDDEIIRNLKQI
ncbi:hypothetical protein ACOME3_002904 [Neoechinorhynchus agilis]